MVNAKSAAGPTTVAAVAVLLARIGSNWLARAVTVALILPAAVGITVITAEARPALVNVPKLKTTTLPLMETMPCVEFADWIAVLMGSVLVTVTLEAVDGPLLVTETV